MSCLYAPYVSPVEKKLRERLKAARSRMEGQAYRRDARVALPVPVVEIPKPAPVVAESWVDRQKRIWFWIESDLGPTRPITMTMIQNVVCEHFDLSRADLLSQRRAPRYVRPRQIAMYLCKTLTQHSLPEIGRHFAGRDHTTALHAVRKIEGLAAVDPEISKTIRTLTVNIKGDDHACVTPGANRIGESLADGSKAPQSSPRRDGIDAAGFDGSATQVRKS